MAKQKRATEAETPRPAPTEDVPEVLQRFTRKLPRPIPTERLVEIGGELGAAVRNLNATRADHREIHKVHREEEAGLASEVARLAASLETGLEEIDVDCRTVWYPSLGQSVEDVACDTGESLRLRPASDTELQRLIPFGFSTEKVSTATEGEQAEKAAERGELEPADETIRPFSDKPHTEEERAKIFADVASDDRSVWSCLACAKKYFTDQLPTVAPGGPPFAYPTSPCCSAKDGTDTEILFPDAWTSGDLDEEEKRDVADSDDTDEGQDDEEEGSDAA